MNSDFELLKLAAKAVGLQPHQNQSCVGLLIDDGTFFNPIEDDGDAFRLAVRLRFEIQCYPGMGGVIYDDGSPDGGYVQQNPESGQDDATAVRRAIVKAAAIIGESMP